MYTSQYHSYFILSSCNCYLFRLKSTNIIKRVWFVPSASVFPVWLYSCIWYYHAVTHSGKAFPTSVVFYTNSLLPYLDKTQRILKGNSKYAHIQPGSPTLVSQWSFSISMILFWLPSSTFQDHNPHLSIFLISCHLTASKVCSHLLTPKEFPDDSAPSHVS